MSNNESKNSTYVLTPLDVAGIVNNAGGLSAYRPYFTERNALRIKPLLDEVYNAKSSFFASCDTFKCSASALHTKLNDGLNWLRTHHADKKRYQVLRDCIKMRRVEHGVKLIWKIPATYKVTDLEKLAADDAIISWFDAFTAWLMTAKECDVFDSLQKFGGSVPISDEQETALIRVCASLGAELDLRKADGAFRVMR